MSNTAFARATAVIFTLIIAIFPINAQEIRAPLNDNFAGATLVTPRGVMNADYAVTSAQTASMESGEPVPSCAVGSIFDSIWYEFTAPFTIDFSMHTFDSALTIASGASDDTVVALYASSSSSPTFANLTEAACGQGGTSAASLSWRRQPAGRYFLQVASENALTGTSTYDVDFGSRYQLLANTHFGTSTPVLAPWTVIGVGIAADKPVCLAPGADNCHFRFKVSANENSTLRYNLTNLGRLPHDTGPKNYSEFVLDVEFETERAQTNATATIEVTFANGTKRKGSRSLDSSGAIFVDPINGSTPVSAVVRVKHNGKSGAPLYITQVELYYVPGATGRDAGDVLPIPPPQ